MEYKIPGLRAYAVSAKEDHLKIIVLPIWGIYEISTSDEVMEFTGK